MKDKWFFILCPLALAVFLCSGCQATSASGGPVSWIDKPHNGSSFDMQAIIVIAHSNDPGGLAEVEVSVNGQVIETLPASGTFAETTATWYPDKEGNYVLRVRARNAAGAWGGYAEANIQIGGATPTTPPTITPTGVTPTDTPTLPPAVKKDLFFKANKSTGKFFYGNCGANSVTIQAYVSDTSQAQDVLLFANLQDQQSGAATGWDGGESMKAAGNGWYQRTVTSTSISKHDAYASSWLLYQFVVTGKGGIVVAKSPVYSDIVLSGCTAAPGIEEPPAQGITPIRNAPAIRQAPIKTLIPGPK